MFAGLFPCDFAVTDLSFRVRIAGRFRAGRLIFGFRFNDGCRLLEDLFGAFGFFRVAFWRRRFRSCFAFRRI
jgi:hypothetical protein